jgi:GT2 family glycosyltransferase
MSESYQIDLSIVIVSWNVCELLRQCLHSIEDNINPGVKYEVSIVDNHSSDDSVTMIKTEFPKACLTCNADNLGFAKAANQGIKLSRGNYVLLLNPDVRLYEGAVDNMLSFLQVNPGVGMVGPSMQGYDAITRHDFFNHISLGDSILGSSILGIFPPLLKRREPPLAFDKPVAVESLIGACLLVRREVIQQVGLLDEDYFMYVEDADWCYRIRKAGWLIYYLPSVAIYHQGGQSAARAPTKMYVAIRKSRVLFLLKHRSRLEAILLSAGYTLNSTFKIWLGDKNSRQAFQQAASAFWSTTLALFAGCSKF